MKFIDKEIALTNFDQSDDNSNTTTTRGPLLVNSTGAGELADRLVGWYIFPVDGKTPKCLWQSHAATGRADVEALWRRFTGYNEDGTEILSGVGVACDPSNIFVIDEDRDWRSDELHPGTDWQDWATALDSCHSLILPSSNRGRPHYYFRQPSDGLGKVAERVWYGGEVKSKGFVVLASAGPISQPSSAGGGLWTPADVAEAVPPLVTYIGRRRSVDSGAETQPGGSRFGNRVTKEEFAVWLGQDPGEHFGGRLIAEEYEASFISKLIEGFEREVNAGTSRRAACLNAVHTATIEAYQGLYSHLAAYDALLDAYAEMRAHGPGDTGGEKGWTTRREDDYRSMWETEITKPDALEAAENSYDKLLERLTSAGVGMEISEAERDEDAYCFDIILAASSGASDSVVPDFGSSEPEPEPEPQRDELEWDDVSDVEQKSPKPELPGVETESPVVLGDEAKRGVLWDLAEGLIGKHELPHVALMITLAGWAGVVLGSAGAGAMRIGEDRHGPELCVCMVGTSAVSHKSGTVTFGHMVFNEWNDPLETGISAPGQGSGFFREVAGIESGQAFVEAWPGAAEIAGGAGLGRAVVMVEKELTTMWKKAGRNGSTIPEETRKAWDGDMLVVRGIRAGNHRVQPKNYRFSAIGATIHTLAASTIVESGAHISGDGNRWLWCWGQEVPRPVKGAPSFTDHPLVEAIRIQVRGLIRSIERARSQGWWPGTTTGPGGIAVVEFGEPKLWWTPEADLEWLGDVGTPRDGMGIYADLQNELRENASGTPITKGLKGRNAQQVMRLAIGYEMLKAGDGWAGLVKNTMRADGTAWCISLEALRWACAVWRYCSDTIDHMFSKTTGNAKVDELVSAIRELGRDLGNFKFPGFVYKTDIIGTGFSKNSVSALLAEAERQGAIWTGILKREGRKGAPPVVVGLNEWPVPSDVLKRVFRG